MDWDVFFALIGIACTLAACGSAWLSGALIFESIKSEHEHLAIIMVVVTVVLVIISALLFAAADNPNDVN